MSNSEHVPVLIVGAGPAGLTAALFLARLGIPALVVERHTNTSLHPRARGLNVRTMEIFRGAGLEAPIMQAGAALAASKYMLFVETLTGTEIRRVPDDDLVITGTRLAAITPCTWVQCAQDELEPLVLAAAQQAGATVRFATEMVALTQVDAGVTVTLRDVATDTITTMRASYVLAADGAKSRIRAALNIPFVEQAVQGHYVNIYFRADLRPWIQGREFALCFVENPAAPGILLAVNNADRWLFNAEYAPTTTSPEIFTPDQCRALVRAAVGVTDLPVEVLSVLPWDATAQCVTQMQANRVFLLGDAAHTMPPAGGLGLNTGVADAHNLAWKLALVLKGNAPPSLLATFEAERLPVAQQAVDQAARELNAERPDGPPVDSKGDPLVEQLLPMLGFTYHSSAVFAAGESPEPGLHLDGQPGTRLPHGWLDQNGRQVSTLDLVEQGFVALLGPQGEAWRVLFQEVAHQENMPLTVYRVAVDGEVADPTNQWCTTSGIDPSGMLLVRPDGVVAWRARTYDATAIAQASLCFRQLFGYHQA